jgi:hypothetical protein
MTVHRSLSPARDSVAFIATAGPPGGKLMTAGVTVVSGNVAASPAQVLYQTPLGVSYPAWSPDGPSIAFVDWDDSDDYFIEVVPSSGLQPGESPTRLYTAPHPLALNQPEWSRAGDRLFFTEYNQDVPGSYVIKALDLDVYGNPSGTELILSDPRFGNGCGEVSVAWTRPSLAFGAGGYIYVLDLDTGSVTPICGGGAPAWSPDDSMILFSITSKGKTVLQTITLATGPITTIGAGSDPDWK